MQARTPRREQLLQATAEYILANGISDLSLRPLARAIGTKARLLIYHFGSREALVSSALSLVLRRVQQAFLTMHSQATLDRALLQFWRWATDKPNVPYLQLVFEVHGLAPRNPRMYGGYVREAIESWKSLVAERISRRNTTPQRREKLATVIVAVFDGLLLDYLATGDRERTMRALRLFLKGLERRNGGRI